MMKTICAAFVLLIQTLLCLASDDSPFQLTNKATGVCLVRTSTNDCSDIRWTTGDRLMDPQRKKCLGVQGKSVGSEISFYDCDENSELQKWECKNETVLALKGQELYIELKADNTAALSRTTGPNSHFIISGMSNGACTRTYREFYAIGGNAAGMLCMFPFKYNDQWYSDCISAGPTQPQLRCAVETKFQSQRWGYCPVTSKDGWNKHPTTGAYYQLNTQAVMTWSQAETSCKQQGASLLSITDPHEQAYIIAILGVNGNKLWTGLVLDPEHGWKWTDGRPYRYLKWDSGYPQDTPGHNCAILDPAVQYSWQSSPCSKKLGYICYSKAAEEVPTQAPEAGFCAKPWIPYNGHCFHLNRTKKTWTDSQRDCRDEGGDLVSIRNLEDQSFIISQLGYESNDELWIGLNDRKTEGLFDWIDHSTVSFTSWEFGRPLVHTDVNDCIFIKGENGNWADGSCGEKRGFICMKMSRSRPTGDEVVQNVGCKAGWRRHGSYCYFTGEQTKTFDEAKDGCKSLESYLVDVTNGVDNAFLISLVGLRPEKYFWLGLSNQKNIDQFVWTNTDTVRFTHWNAEMPGNQQGCVAMKTGIFAGLWDVLPCTNRQKYICKHLAEGAAVTPAPPTLIPPKCPDGWTNIGPRNYCFKIYRFSSSSSLSSTKKRTWYEARDFCRAIGGDLLSIHNEAELQALPQRYDSAWIGLSAPDPLTGYTWSDGSPLQFKHWEEGEPNNKNNVESCTEMKIHKKDRGGSWNDVHCETYLGWICQIRAGLIPEPTPADVTPDYNTTSDGWLEWNGNQYYFNRRSMAMEEARHYCQQKHSDLVSITTEAEAVFVWKQITKSYGSFWIGLTVDFDKTYGWMDGSPVAFQRWDENQPDFQNNDENCVAMTTSMGFWHDYTCGMEFKSICKRSESPPVNTTVAPTVPPKGGCRQGWKKIDTKCYKVITDQKEKWDDARTKCKSMGGNLATVLSQQVQVFLTATMVEAPTIDLWIGLHNSKGGSFYWTVGKPVRYTNWGTVNRHESFRPYHHHHRFAMHYHDHYMFDDFEPDYGLGHYTLSQRQCTVMTTDSKVGIGKWLKKSCNDTNGYICLQDVDPAVPDTPEPITTNYVQIFNDSIKAGSQQMNWYAARKYCEGEGAKLASMRNKWSQIYIEMLALKLNSSVWIGINKNQTGGYYKYVDGWRLEITNWDYGEPRSQPCVLVNKNGKWSTADCNQNATSICMKTTDVAPTESSEFPGFCPEDPETPRYTRQTFTWLPFRKHCYLFFTEKVQWPVASTNCQKHGAALVSIEDPFEEDFIKSNIQLYKDNENSFWIGLYKTHKGLWLWFDKAVMDYSNWRGNEPSSGDYGMISSYDGTWSSGRRWYDRGYICKTNKILRAAPPTVPHVDPQTRGRVVLPVVLVITAIIIGTAIALFLFKKSGRRLPIPEKLTTFDNPLFFNNERHRSEMVDTNKLVANAEEENPGPVVTV
ncbi:macrophage mannose receptor 1 isoform X2 [Larimichthys crocea]|uniref:macrophage mannose receptor 1 isoform X2 n=1 Tax=Larimichthys crocea TaxID=215358 RepID=UPI000F5DE83C|nr:macrophage mannose receptor 1 isoform X2 [Larimichthys crocea]